jgi:hypothetical protein
MPQQLNVDRVAQPPPNHVEALKPMLDVVDVGVRTHPVRVADQHPPAITANPAPICGEIRRAAEPGTAFTFAGRARPDRLPPPVRGPGHPCRVARGTPAVGRTRSCRLADDRARSPRPLLSPCDSPALTPRDPNAIVAPARTARFRSCSPSRIRGKAWCRIPRGAGRSPGVRG